MRFITFFTVFVMACACTGYTIDNPQQACAPVTNACAPITSVPEAEACAPVFQACAPVYQACAPVIQQQTFVAVPYTVQAPLVVEPLFKFQIPRPFQTQRIHTERTIIRERTIRTGPRYEICPPCQNQYNSTFYMVATPEYDPCF